MTNRYRSSIDWVFYIAMILMALLTIGLPILVFFDEEGGKLPAVLMFGVVGTIASLIFSLPKTTHYTFEENDLLCKSSFLKKRIPYSAITRIDRHNGLYAGWKFSLSSKGLLIHYNKFDELYISPENQDQFIEDLLSKNPSIKVL